MPPAPQHLLDLGAGLVVADHAQQARIGAQRRSVARDVGCAAQSLFAPFYAHDRDRRFRRNAAHFAEPVAVQHDVANHQDAHRIEYRRKR